MTRTRTVAAIVALAILLLGLLAIRGCSGDPSPADPTTINTDRRDPGTPITAPGSGDGGIIKRD